MTRSRITFYKNTGEGSDLSLFARSLAVQTGRILSDRIRIRIRKLDTDIQYSNIRADTDMILNFNYPYPNNIYIYHIVYHKL